jgi:hypothetical protein
MPRCVVATIACVVMAIPVKAHARRPDVLIVRVYNRFGVPRRDLDIADAVASSVLAEAGVAVQWRACAWKRGSTRASEGDACADTVQPWEVSMRIVRAPRDGVAPDVLGDSIIDGASRRGTLGTVFADRVDAAAPGLQVAPATLLGRAIAHEIGHLLLGTTAHSPTGLMRGNWTASYDTSADRAGWQFLPEQAIAMHAAMQARLSTVSPVAAMGIGQGVGALAHASQ